MVLTIREYFPPKGPLETPAVLRALVAAHLWQSLQVQA